MDTFEDTLTNEDYEQILRNLPPDSRDLSLSHEAERIREGFIGCSVLTRILSIVSKMTRN